MVARAVLQARSICGGRRVVGDVSARRSAGGCWLAGAAAAPVSLASPAPTTQHLLTSMCYARRQAWGCMPPGTDVDCGCEEGRRRLGPAQAAAVECQPRCGLLHRPAAQRKQQRRPAPHGAPSQKEPFKGGQGGQVGGQRRRRPPPPAVGLRAPRRCGRLATRRHFMVTACREVERRRGCEAGALGVEGRRPVLEQTTMDCAGVR